MIPVRYYPPHTEYAAYEEASAINGSISNGEPIVGPASEDTDVFYSLEDLVL